MTLKTFKDSMDDWYCFVHNGGYPKEMDAFPEDEQDSFFNGYQTAFRDIVAALNMDKLLENKQNAFLKGYYTAMRIVLKELKTLR